MGDPETKAEIRGGRVSKNNRGTAVGEKRTNKANKTRRKTRDRKRLKETTMPNRVKGAGKIKSGKNSAASWLRRVKTAENR